MATQPNTSGRKLLIMIGDGESPESFLHYCSFNADRGFAREKATTDENDQDCDEPDLPGWLTRTTDSYSANITGSGRVKLGDVEFLDELFEDPNPRNIKVKIDMPGGRTYTGAYIMTNLTYTGPEQGSMTFDATFVSSGPVTAADNV